MKTEEQEHAEVMRVMKSVLVLCSGQSVAVAGVGLAFALIELRMADSTVTRAGACRLLASQFESMAKDEKEPS